MYQHAQNNILRVDSIGQPLCLDIGMQAEQHKEAAAGSRTIKKKTNQTTHINNNAIRDQVQTPHLHFLLL